MALKAEAEKWMILIGMSFSNRKSTSKNAEELERTHL